MKMLIGYIHTNRSVRSHETEYVRGEKLKQRLVQMPQSHIALPFAPRLACTHIGIGQSALTRPWSRGRAEAALLHSHCALLGDRLSFPSPP